MPALRLCFIVALTLLSTAAIAGPTYELMGGDCVEGTRSYTYKPGPYGDFVKMVGSPICGGFVSVRITMPAGYVPGTSFSYVCCSDFPRIEYEDAYSHWHMAIGHESVRFAGFLPDEFGTAALSWSLDAELFTSNADGTWLESEECFHCVELPYCNPMPDGSCRDPIGSTFSRGTYLGWRLIPVPVPLTLLLAAGAAWSAVRRRRGGGSRQSEAGHRRPQNA